MLWFPFSAQDEIFCLFFVFVSLIKMIYLSTKLKYLKCSFLWPFLSISLVNVYFVFTKVSILLFDIACFKLTVNSNFFVLGLHVLELMFWVSEVQPQFLKKSGHLI